MKDTLNTLCDDVLTPAQAATVNAVRREFHASNALKGLLSNLVVPTTEETQVAAYCAVKAADALIAELDKPQT